MESSDDYRKILRDRLKSAPTNEERAAAAEALGYAMGKHAPGALHQAMVDDDSPLVRAAATVALGRIIGASIGSGN